ncbi:MAG: Rrf2 family transcriptional regulator [Oscillospiraceae bacterium]|jgi:Rrf2 family iron-responsive transcriptional regulator|nr:Rrf2 family transcriptional regulator [Oscillospiraceae bacterium]MDD3261557.1 Rrf2 family transcriptional regulator [Oscillospiraceae bacterium]
MLVTREMDYAVRTLRALFRSERLSAKQIAAREHMQPSITYKTLHRLTKAGLVKSYRGSDGGYSLCDSSEKLTLYDVFRALQEDLFLTPCLQPGDTCENNTNGSCRVHREYQRIQHLIIEELQQKPLRELLQE